MLGLRLETWLRCSQLSHVLLRGRETFRKLRNLTDQLVSSHPQAKEGSLTKCQLFHVALKGALGQISKFLSPRHPKSPAGNTVPSLQTCRREGGCSTRSATRPVKEQGKRHRAEGKCNCNPATVSTAAWDAWRSWAEEGSSQLFPTEAQ